MKFPFSSLVVGFVFLSLLSSCGLFNKKGTATDKANRKGEVTGVAKRVRWKQNLPVDMVPIKAGTFWMGQSDEDIAYTQASSNKQITISEFFMDKYEVSNNKYRQFLEAVKSGQLETGTPTTLKAAPTFTLNDLKPDSTVWTKSFAFHYGDPLMEFYFDHPAFDTYPVVGVSYDQAQKYAEWRTYHLRANDDVEFDLPAFRLPTEAEWEYAAKGGKDIAKYPWGGPYLKNKRGCLMANFKPGRGNYTDDGYAYSAPVDVYEPNGFGLYNMSGNVNEWVADVYRPMSSKDVDDFNPYRGNVFTKNEKDANGEFQRDSIGRVKTVVVTDEEARTRRNYQKGNVINYLDGDSLSMVNYGYGTTTLVSDKSRVFKGGSWDDRAYWLSPGTRRHLEEDQATSTIGFRCAMDRFGSQEGNGFKNGNQFSNRRQNTRKK
jgi:gliding motility-associated lipoprotein GldK